MNISFYLKAFEISTTYFFLASPLNNSLHPTLLCSSLCNYIRLNHSPVVAPTCKDSMTPTLCCCEVVHVCVIFVLTVRVRMTKDRYLTGTKTRQAKYCFCSESGHSTKQVLEKIIGQVPAAAHQWMERKNGQLKKKKKAREKDYNMCVG